MTRKSSLKDTSHTHDVHQDSTDLGTSTTSAVPRLQLQDCTILVTLVKELNLDVVPDNLTDSVTAAMNLERA